MVGVPDANYTDEGSKTMYGYGYANLTTAKIIAQVFTPSECPILLVCTIITYLCRCKIRLRGQSPKNLPNFWSNSREPINRMRPASHSINGINSCRFSPRCQWWWVLCTWHATRSHSKKCYVCRRKLHSRTSHTSNVRASQIGSAPTPVWPDISMHEQR